MTMSLYGNRVSSCYNAANGFWYLLSAPFSSGYTNGQQLSKTLNGPSYYSTNFNMPVVGPYALQFAVYDNCAVYTRNVTIVWDGTLAHVLPPTTVTNSQCDGNLAPVKIASSPIKRSLWTGTGSQFTSVSITTGLTVRESSGSEAVTYRWGLNVTDGQQIRSALTTTSSVYQIGNWSSTASTTNETHFISSETAVGPTAIITGTGPLSGTHSPFKGSPAGGLFAGTISRLGYLSRERTVTTTTNSSYFTYNTTAAVIVTGQTCNVALNWGAASSWSMSLTATVAVPASFPPTGDAAHWPFITAGAKCAGTYMLSVHTKDDSNCSSSDYDWFNMDCGPQPNAVLSPCNAAVIKYQYSDRTLRWQGTTVVLDGTLSVDPLGRTTTCCYQFVTVPAGSLLGGSVSCSYCVGGTPPSISDVAGTYEIALWATNYCSASKVTHTYTVTCDTYTVSTSITGTNPSPYDGTTGLGSNGVVTSTSTSSATAPEVGGTITQLWTFDSVPALPTWVASLIGPAGAFSPFPTLAQTSTLAAPTVYSRMKGDYVTRVTATVGCQQSGSAVHTYTMTCQNDLIADAGTDVSTTDTCGTGWAQVVLTGGFTRTTTQVSTFPLYYWTLSSAPTGSSITVGTQVPGSATMQFTPDVAGAYVWKLSVFDYCQVGTDDTVTVTAVSNPDVIPDIVISTPAQSTYYSKDSINIQATNIGTWTYLWNVTTYPNGVVPSSGLAGFTFGATTYSAYFTALPSGTYWVTVTITTACGAKKSASFRLDIICPYPLGAVVGGYVSGSTNSSTTVVTTWPENNNWRQVTLTGTASSYGQRYITNVTADWVVISAPVDSLWAPLVNTTWVTNTFDTVTGNLTFRQVVTRQIVTKQFTHVQPSALATLEACFQPDLPGEYVIEMRLSDGCQASVATITVRAACVEPPVAIITRRGSLPPNAGGSSIIAQSTDGSLSTTTPPSDGTRMYLDASSSYSKTPGVTLGYYWTWLSPSTQAFSSQGIDPANGPRILLSPPYPANSTLILYVSDGCTYSTARVLVSCGSDVSPSLASYTVTANVDPYTRTVPEFVVSTGSCYPYEMTKWHLVSYSPSVRDYTMQAQATKYNSAPARQSLSGMMMASVAMMIAMVFYWN
jgi:hypothetical protein